MLTLHQRLAAAGRGVRGILFPYRTVPLHAIVTSCGFQRMTGADYDWHGLRRGPSDLIVLQYTLSGEGRLTFDGRSQAIRAGTLLLLHIPHDHRYWLPVESPFWEFLYVCLAGMEAVRLTKKLQERVGPLVALSPDSATVGLMAGTYERAKNGDITSPFQSSAVAYELLMTLCDELASHRPEKQASVFVERVQAYCKAHFAEPLSVDQLASVAGYSRYHFSRRFKNETGMAPAHYLNDVRLREAARLLRETALSVKEVTFRCGFSDRNYFGKAFSKAFGVSPGAFRRRGA